MFQIRVEYDSRLWPEKDDELRDAAGVPSNFGGMTLLRDTAHECVVCKQVDCVCIRMSQVSDPKSFEPVVSIEAYLGWDLTKPAVLVVEQCDEPVLVMGVGSAACMGRDLGWEAATFEEAIALKAKLESVPDVHVRIQEK